MDLLGAETGEGDGTVVAAPSRWLLVLAKKKQWPRWFWPLFLASSYFLLFSFPPSMFYFLFPFFSFYTREQKLMFSAFYLHVFWLFFSALFSLFFSSFYALSFCFSFLESWRWDGPRRQVLKLLRSTNGCSLWGQRNR
jgi:hypothetical protein